jgi:hypothetical protein
MERGKNFSEGLQQIANAFLGINKFLQLRKVTEGLSSKYPEFTGVTDPDVLKLLFEQKRLEREDERAAVLARLYGAQTKLAETKAGKVGPSGGGGGGT